MDSSSVEYLLAWLPGAKVAMTGVCLAVSLWLALPRGIRPTTRRKVVACLFGLVGLVLLWSTVPRYSTMTMQTGFTIFAVYTVFSSAAAITSRSPVYCAIWFAASLLGVAILLLLQGAQFLGIATIAVYAGAIVVTFLFVLMLAQPAGHSFYDRISWGAAPPFVASVTAVFFTVIVAAAVTDPHAVQWQQAQTERLEAVNGVLQRSLSTADVRNLRIQQYADGKVAHLEVAVQDVEERAKLRQPTEQLQRELIASVAQSFPTMDIHRVGISLNDVRTPYHTASLGSRLFSRNLVAIQASGALLMAALVGAVAIAARSGELETKRGVA